LGAAGEGVSVGSAQSRNAALTDANGGISHERRTVRHGSRKPVPSKDGEDKMSSQRWQRPARVRPRLESLEDRYLLAAAVLDSSFAQGGLALLPISNDSVGAEGVLVQADGKTVVVGGVSNGRDSDFALARYNADGSLDTGFGPLGNGTILTDFAHNQDEAAAVVQQADGKLVAVGTARFGFQDMFALARYNPDGTLDTSFGLVGNGEVLSNFGVGGAVAEGVALQSDGKIVVVGRVALGGKSFFAVVRYNTDGSRDTTFGLNGNGTATVDLGNAGADAGAVAVGANGAIVVAGVFSADGGQTFHPLLVRYNGDGTIDGSFGAGGVMTLPTVATDGGRLGLALQGDGKIVLAAGLLGSTEAFGLVRFNANGTVDGSFGNGGLAPVGFPQSAAAVGVVVQNDGKLVAAGTAVDGAGQVLALVRYNTDGSLDGSFGDNGGGRVTLAVGGAASAAALALQADGKIVVVGTEATTDQTSLFVARYLNDAPGPPPPPPVAPPPARPPAAPPRAIPLVRFFRLRPSPLGDNNLSLNLSRLRGVQQKVMVHNRGPHPVVGPLWLEVDNLRHAVRLLSPGEKPAEAAKGSRYTFLRVPTGTLAPGGRAEVVVRFRRVARHRKQVAKAT
jgi:uncharacterized delta-60 repeat protein